MLAFGYWFSLAFTSCLPHSRPSEVAWLPWLYTVTANWGREGAGTAVLHKGRTGGTLRLAR